jgi:integrase
MPVVKLTPTFISKLRAPHDSGKQVLYLDTVTKGFGVQVSGTTTAVDYIAQRELPKKIAGAKKQTRRVNIGPANGKVLTLEAARERAEEVLDQIRRGIDPRSKAEPVAMYTLRQVKELYFVVKQLSKGSRRTYGHHIDNHLTDWLDLPLSSITPEMVEMRHREIASKIAKGERYDGKASANDAMNTLGILWRFAAKRVALPACPVGRLQDEKQWFPRQRRTTRVSAEHLPAFYEAVCALKIRTHRDLLLLLMFTGFRVTETKRLKWSNVDLAARTITLFAPDTKTKKTVELPMSDFVHDLLVGRRALGQQSEYVFPGQVASQPISGAQRAFEKIEKATGIAVSPHPLRRTFMKVGASARVNYVWLKVLSNHALPADVTSQHYLAPELEDLREPAQQVAAKLLVLCNAKPVTAVASNVAKLR